jgi:hypothetical protein
VEAENPLGDANRMSEIQRITLGNSPSHKLRHKEENAAPLKELVPSVSSPHTETTHLGARSAYRNETRIPFGECAGRASSV